MSGSRATILALAALTLIMGACRPRVPQAPEPPVGDTWVYSCPDDYRFSARFLGGVVSLRLPTRTVALPRARSTTGARYAVDGMEFAHAGTAGSLMIEREISTRCTGERAATPWDEARLLGAEFRAAGREPTWSLEIDTGGHMRFVIEGASEVITPAPDPERADGTTRYRATSAGHEIDLVIREQACPDPLLGQALTHTVELAVDGFPYRGCGRMLGSAPASE